MDEYHFYQYHPSIPGNAIFAVLFAGVTILHMWKMIRSKTMYFIPFVIGGFLEVIGYVARITQHDTIVGHDALAGFCVQSICILIAPSLFSATMYMILSRLAVSLSAESRLPIRPTRVTKIFVIADVFSLFMQSSGAGLMSGGDGKNETTGKNIVLVGLMFQVLFFFCFLAIFTIFLRRLAASPTTISKEAKTSAPWQENWATLAKTVYALSAFVVIRNIFRVIEYAGGNEGYLMQNEAWMFVFDGVLMFIVMLGFYLVHPSGAVEHGNRELRSSDSDVPLNYD